MGKLRRKSISIGSIAAGQLQKNITTARNSIVIDGKTLNKDTNSAKYYLASGAARVRSNKGTGNRTGAAAQNTTQGVDYLNEAAAVMDALRCTVDMSKGRAFSLQGDETDIELENLNINSEKEWGELKNSKQSAIDRFPSAGDPIYNIDSPRSQNEQNNRDDIKRTRQNLRQVGIAADLARVNLDPQFNTQSKYFKSI